MRMQVLKTNYKGRGKWKAVAEALNAIGRAFNGMVGFGGIRIEAAGQEVRFFGPGAPGRAIVPDFGIVSFLGDVVTIKGGEIQIGENAAVACVDTPVTITADYDKVGWRFVLASQALSIVNFGASVPYQDGIVKKWTHQFRYTPAEDDTPARASLYRDGHLNPVFPAVWGGVPT